MQNLSKVELDDILSETSPHSFKHNIERLHKKYELPIVTEPSLVNAGHAFPSNRIRVFAETIRGQLAEIEKAGGLIDQLHVIERLGAYQGPLSEQALVALASWLGHLIVSLRSEAMRFGIPMEEVLEAINGTQYKEIPPGPAISTIMFGLGE